MSKHTPSWETLVRRARERQMSTLRLGEIGRTVLEADAEHEARVQMCVADTDMVRGLLDQVRAALHAPQGHPITEHAALVMEQHADLVEACTSDAAALRRITQRAKEALGGSADATAMLELIIDLASYSACAEALKRVSGNGGAA